MIQRRDFLRGSIIGVGFLAGTALSDEKPRSPKKKEAEGEEDVSPAEDLMREHGVLKRVLLIYREAVHRLQVGAEAPLGPLAEAAGIIRSFIEDYHEKLEEDFLFPRFRRGHDLVDLVDVLQAQHAAGRQVTDTTLQLAKLSSIGVPERKRLEDSLISFVRMYEPHEAREDTVLFPALRKLIKGHEYDALGEDFEKKEHQLFGEEGFEKMVDKVAGIEKRLGIYELSQFTAKA